MRSFVISIAIQLVVVHLAPAAEPIADWKGVKVMPKRGIVFSVGGKTTNQFHHPEPWTVSEVNGDSLNLSRGGSVWVERNQVVTLEEAPAYYTEVINAGGDTKAWAYRLRSAAWEARGDLDQAIADYGEYLQLEPSAWGYDIRGAMLSRKQKYDEAISDFDKAVRLDPDEASFHIDRGRAWAGKKSYEKALADFNEALRLAPDDASIINDVAMFLATCPEERFRNGRKAVELATKACESSKWGYFSILDTLAAAYAETGDFDSAVKFQKNAIEKNPTDAGFVKRSRERLSLYELRKPYRDE